MNDCELKDKIIYQKNKTVNLGNCLKIVLNQTKELGDYFSCNINKESANLYNDIYELVRINNSLVKMINSQAVSNAYYEKLALLNRKLEMGIQAVSKKIALTKMQIDCEKN